MPERKFFYYNDKPEILYKEYGRTVQGMVKHIAAETEDDKRNQMFRALMEFMKRINPSFVIENEDDQRKLWNQLHAMSDYELNVEGKFAKPEPSAATPAPDRVAYSDYKIKNKHYGRNFELLLAQAKVLTDPEEIEGAVVKLGRLIKNFYNNSNKENMEDEVIIHQIEALSNGKLTISIDKVQEFSLFDLPKDTPKAAILPHERVQERRNQNNNNKNRNRNFARRK